MGFAKTVVMRAISYFLLIFSLWLTPSVWAEESKKGVVLEEGVNTEVKERMTEAAVAEAEITHENIIIRTRRGAEFEFSYGPTGEMQSRIYELMPPEEIQSFQKNRLLILQLAATTLGRFTHILGMGNSIRETMHYLEGRAPFDAKQPTISERGLSVIERILSSFDRFLWSQAPDVAKRPEVAGHLSGHPAFVVGVPKWFAGGIVGLGINFGYNLVEKTMTFEIFTEFEKPTKLHTPVVYPGFSIRIGAGLLGHEDADDPTATRRGKHFYPLVIPAYFIRSDLEDAAGVELTPFPPYVTGLYKFETKAVEKPLLRITAKRKRPGVFRLYLGFPSKIKSFCSRLFTGQK